MNWENWDLPDKRHWVGYLLLSVRFLSRYPSKAAPFQLRDNFDTLILSLKRKSDKREEASVHKPTGGARLWQGS